MNKKLRHILMSITTSTGMILSSSSYATTPSVSPQACPYNQLTYVNLALSDCDLCVAAKIPPCTVQCQCSDAFNDDHICQTTYYPDCASLKIDYNPNIGGGILVCSDNSKEDISKDLPQKTSSK